MATGTDCGIVNNAYFLAPCSAASSVSGAVSTAISMLALVGVVIMSFVML